MRTYLLVAVTALAVAVASGAPPDAHLDGSRIAYPTAQMPSSWKLLAFASDKAPLHDRERVEFRLALRQRNLDLLTQTFDEVSSPDHPRFARYLTKAEVDAMVAPSPRDKAVVVDWLRRGGARVDLDGGDVLHASGPAADMEKLLGDVRLAWVAPPATDKRTRGPGGARLLKVVRGTISLPAAVAAVVQFVQGLGEFPEAVGIGGFAVGGADDDSSDDVVIPLTLKNNYHAGGLTITTNSSIGVVEYASDQAFSSADMTKFVKGCGLPQEPNAFHKTGPFSGVDGEATLDVQWATAMGVNATNYYFTLSGWLLDFAQDLYALASPPLVNSQSWATDERQQGADYNGRLDAEYRKLGLRGVTMLAASGDSGASGTASCGGAHTFSSPYPGASPAALSVGATMLADGSATQATGPALPPVCNGQGFTCAASGVETAANSPASSGQGFATGGGFAALATQPAYQKAAVDAYLSDPSVKLPPAADYNASHRAFPDVSANGDNIIIVQGGSWQITGGTSASTPIWAGMLAIVNDKLLRAGKAPLGFVNPLLYKAAAEAPDTFTVIGTGNNNNGCPQGWQARKGGYSPVAGLGTPNLQALLAYVDAHLDVFPPRPAFI